MSNIYYREKLTFSKKKKKIEEITSFEQQKGTRSEAVAQRCSVKKVFLEMSQNSQENTCARVFFNKVAGLGCNFIEKETLAQMLSCEVCVLFKNTYFYRTTLVAVSARYIRGNVYFGIIAFSCLSSRKPCLIFLLICFAREIKAFIGVPWEMRLISGT